MARVGARKLTWLGALAMAIVAVAPLAAQTVTIVGVDPSSPSLASPDGDSALPRNLDRIRRGLTLRKGLFVLHRDVPVFRVSIEQELPGLEAWLGDPKALQRGPWTMSPYHQEFLDMVTPPEARASFTSGELLQVLITGLAGKLAARGLASTFDSLRSGRAAEAACLEVRQTLLDLNEARALAGLAPAVVTDCP